MWSWNYGLDFWDEGFLWYGVQRTLYGEVPVRDFMAYDVGRYYLAAAIGMLAGDGLAPLRWISVLFEAFLLVMALHVVKPALPSWRVSSVFFLFFLAVLVVLWVYPYYQVYNYLATVAVVLFARSSMNRQLPGTWFWCGVGVGVLALVGRNHGVYGVITFMLVLAGLVLSRSIQWLSAIRLAFSFFLGVAVGYAPNLMMALWVPGYLDAMVAIVLDMVAQGATNLPLPVPWPWQVTVGASGGMVVLSNLMIGLGFCLLIVVPFVALLLLLARKVAEPARTSLAACAAAAVPYAHYAFSRPDSGHLAQSMLPSVLAIAIMVFGLGPWRRMTVMLGFLGFTVCVMGFTQPVIEYRVFGAAHEAVQIGGARIFTGPSKAQYWRWQESVLSEQAATDSFLAWPNLPSLHAAHRVRFPSWEIYPLVPRTEAFQAKEIAELAANPPRLIILSDHQLDGRPGARFSDYHSHTYEWIRANYDVVVPGNAPSSPDMKVFVRKQSERL